MKVSVCCSEFVRVIQIMVMLAFFLVSLIKLDDQLIMLLWFEDLFSLAALVEERRNALIRKIT